MGNNTNKLLSVVGATGLVGSNIVREALLRGYSVRGTLRDNLQVERTQYLHKLQGAKGKLTLHSADMQNRESFTDLFKNVDCVFITCLTPTYFGISGKPARDMNDAEGYEQIVKPTLDGCLNIMNVAVNSGVQNIVICSSTSSTNPSQEVPVKNENHWSEEHVQYAAKKYTSAAKTVMEKKAIQFANENNIRLSIFMPTGLYGPVILPEHLKENPHAWITNLINGKEGRHKKIPNSSTSLIHLHDLAALFLAAYENPKTSGRFFGVYDSWHWKNIYSELKTIIPNMKMPEPFDGKATKPTQFDFTRRDSLGVKIRNIPICIRETVDWIKSNPFK